ncbi:MAG: pitrilysin family protein [Candidatus Zapsychrus exili]|nr:pitrilysin family protein [Candidatus Zapsychrus exili]
MKKTIIFLLSIVFLVSISSLSFSSEIKTSKHILENGLTVLISEMPSKEVASLYAVVKTGSATEGKLLGSGISHFLEHMLFKGTDNRKVGQIASEVGALGGTINASTNKDLTKYTITIGSEHVDKALDILSDMLMNSSFDLEELEKEREVVIAEIRKHTDNPDWILDDIAFSNEYIVHPYKHPIIGYENLLSKVSRENLLEYYKTFYSPNNIVLSIAGGIKENDVIEKVEKYFGEFERCLDTIRNLPEEPEQISQRYYETSYPTDVARLVMMYSGTGLLHKDLYALDVLATILGQGESSRLYLDIFKKQGLVYSVSAYNYTPYGRGFFEIQASLSDENIDRARQEILKQIDMAKEGGITEEDLNRAKKRMISSYVLDRQWPYQVALSSALDEVFTGDYKFSKKYSEHIDSISLDDIKSMANKYFRDDRLTTIVMRTKPKEKDDVKIEEAQSSDIKKHKLKNGITVLIKEDHPSKIVSMLIASEGGLNQEPKGLEGLSNLTATMFTKGTKTKTAEEISMFAESLGIRIGGFSGVNSFGISLECISSDFKEAFDLLEDVVKNPIFKQEELDKLKETSRASIMRKQDSIFYITSKELKKNLFKGHALKNEIEGSLESIDMIKQKDLIDFHNSLLTPGNIVISIFGDIKEDDALKLIDDTFGSIKYKNVDLKAGKAEEIKKAVYKEVFEDKEQSMVMFGFQGSSFESKDRWALKVLSNILGASFNGRIFSNIRDKMGKAYSLGGGFIPSKDLGFVYLYAITSKEEVEDVKGLIENEIRKIQEEEVNLLELTNIKEYIKGSFKSGHQVNSALSFRSNLDELYGLGFDNYKNHDQNIENVTSKDVKRVASKYLDLNKAVIVTTKPQNNK